MRSQNLLDRSAWGGRDMEKRSPAWEGYVPERLGASSDGDPADSEDKWQKHVVELLWAALALLILLGSALMYAKGHGLFDSAPGRGTPLPPPWPEGS